tara:strand:- start:306 stop:476 length:171 start_codon:yes stop_codon:yes gene_type:complete
MKNRTRSIENLKREICYLEGKIKFYCKEKPAFSKRLGIILDRKVNSLSSLIENQEK